jgi:hypothetical protein
MKISMILITGTIALAFVLAAMAQTPTRPYGPTATEIFHLRSECAVLADKLVSRLNQEYKDRYKLTNYIDEVVPHYSAVTNECYVKITSRIIPEDPNPTVRLYNAQTRQQLARLDWGGVNGQYSYGSYSFGHQHLLTRLWWLKTFKEVRLRCGEDKSPPRCGEFELSREFIDAVMDDSIYERAK